MALFQKGNNGGGRPRGARNVLSQKLLTDMIEAWEKNGKEALEIFFHDDPGGFVRAMLTALPKEFTVETIESELDDEHLDAIIDSLRQRVLERQQVPKMIEIKSDAFCED
jgi:hypothetical protein